MIFFFDVNANKYFVIYFYYILVAWMYRLFNSVPFFHWKFFNILFFVFVEHLSIEGRMMHV